MKLSVAIFISEAGLEKGASLQPKSDQAEIAFIDIDSRNN